MKKRTYTRRKKIVMLLVFIVFLAIAAAGSLGLYYVNNFSTYLFSKTELMEYRSFTDTETLEQKILSDTGNLFRYCMLSQSFHNQDSYNRNLPFYVIEIDGTAYSVSLNDLDKIALTWEESDQTQRTQGLGVVLGNGNVLLIPENGAADVLYDFIQNMELNETASFGELYSRGSQLLNSFYALRNRLVSGGSNLSYIIYETGAGLLSTNLSEIPETTDSILSVTAPIEALGKYVIFDNDDHSFHSNFTKADIGKSGLDYMATEIAGTKQGISFAVGLDLNFPVQDEYRSMAMDYAKCRPVLLASIPAILIGMLGAIIGFFYLMASVGHQEDFDEIRLDRFDQWPTELSFVLIVAGIFACNAGVALAANVIAKYFFTSNLFIYASQIIAVILSLILGMVGFFSLVKRLKAGVVWKHSLIRKLLSGFVGLIRLMAEHWRASFRAMTWIVLYWLVTIPLGWILAGRVLDLSNGLFVAGICLFLLVQLAAAGAILWMFLKRESIRVGVREIAFGDLEYEIDTKGMYPGEKELAEDINNIGYGLQEALDQAVRSERMKADLITNVSHDIKTPLTSIINYVDLLKRQKVEDPTIARYVQVLDEKSQRLKTLTEDLVEASRASSGNINLQMERICFNELLRQAFGEYEDRFVERKLTPVVTIAETPLYIVADGRRLWRILENLFSNARKYSLPGTRVYIDLEETNGYAAFSIKNISENPLNISPEELTERFTRGDSSRTTEGSGLGLSIAKSLTELQGGYFEIFLNGDLFQAVVEFALAGEAEAVRNEEM